MKLVIHFPNDGFHIDYFVNPIPAMAIIIMGLNDHWLKYAYPSWATGKISDFVGVFYFPLFICAIVCLAQNYLIRPLTKSLEAAYITPRLMQFGISITATLMLVIKVSPQMAGEIQTIFSAWFFPIQLTPDPTDLISFLSLPVSYLYARQFFDQPPRARDAS